MRSFLIYFSQLYGGQVAGRLLTAFAKLFTKYLQLIGFTLGVVDILCMASADKVRRRIMKNGATTGSSVAAKALGMAGDNREVDESELRRRMQEAQFTGGGAELKDLDLSMKGNTDEIQNAIAK